MELEVIGFDLTSCAIAERCGADRIELCANPHEGGTTPSYGTIAVARDTTSIELFPIIRPRGGDFLYSDREFQAMAHDVDQCRQLGCDGVVIGMLLKDGRIDVARCAELIRCAGLMQVTFHRAFDESIEWKRSLDVLIELGFKRVLTSGSAKSVEQGMAHLTEMAAYANGKIEIMAGGGVHAGNIGKLAEIPQLAGIHFSATQKVLLDEDSAFSETILKIDERKLARILEAK